ncbi:DUF5681 domain-containing protein [Brevundimonas diminuta]|uniref:DUF5681 domain-containing protein n=1 Tax=Brevundimonas diminuta TaxID=293 RepID=UPI003CFE9132
MSQNDEPKTYKIGYGRPPQHTQFKPGQSGNAKGRPIRRPRADTPGQLGRDARAVGNMLVKGANGDGIPLIKVILMSLGGAAAKGNATAAKVMLDYYERGCRDNVERNPDLSLIDEIDLGRINRQGRSKQKMGKTLRKLAEQSRRS